jgi:hypothetical protein
MCPYENMYLYMHIDTCISHFGIAVPAKRTELAYTYICIDVQER